MKPHVHCKEIIAWACGSAIEYSLDEGESWLESTRPTWALDILYRVKDGPPSLEPIGRSDYARAMSHEELLKASTASGTAEQAAQQACTQPFVNNQQVAGYDAFPTRGAHDDKIARYLWVTDYYGKTQWLLFCRMLSDQKAAAEFKTAKAYKRFDVTQTYFDK